MSDFERKPSNYGKTLKGNLCNGLYSLLQCFFERHPIIATELLEDLESGFGIVGMNSLGSVLGVVVELLVRVQFTIDVENVYPIDGVRGGDETLLLDVGKEETSDVKTSDVRNGNDRHWTCDRRKLSARSRTGKRVVKAHELD